MKKFIAVVLIISISGCTANMVQHPYAAKTVSKYAPTNEQQDTSGVGITSYMNEGHSSVREARREDAYKKMYEACDGEYVILGQSSSETGDFYYTQGMSNGNSYTTNLSSTYVYIKFQCK